MTPATASVSLESTESTESIESQTAVAAKQSLATWVARAPEAPVTLETPMPSIESMPLEPSVESLPAQEPEDPRESLTACIKRGVSLVRLNRLALS